jgi:uncharacterized protein YkvS
MKVNKNWVKSQFATAKVRIAVGNAVLELLGTWEGLTLTEDQVNQVIEIFSKVAKQHALVEIPKDQVWVQAQRGQLLVGDIVRVRNDAYTGNLAELHNGRPGQIVAIRSGDIIVDITDMDEPIIKGAHYSPEVLEKRIK